MHRRNGWLISLKVCRESIRKWKYDPRIWSIIVLICLFGWNEISRVRQVCIVNGMAISNWYFPFLFGSSMSKIFLFLGIILMFCDAPFVDNQQMFVILRSGKRNWFRGKIMYLFIASCAYFGVMFLVSILEFFPYVGFSMEWEDVLTSLSLDGRFGMYYISISRGVILEFSPIQACLLAYIICVLNGFFLGLVIFYLNLYRGHNLGTSVALVFVLLPGFVELLPLKNIWRMQRFSPVSWTDIKIFVQEHKGISEWYALTFLGVTSVLLISLIMHKAKSYNIEALEEV